MPTKAKTAEQVMENALLIYAEHPRVGELAKSALAEVARLREQAEAERVHARRFPVRWEDAGGPNECAHGYAAGIPCPTCDREAMAAGKLTPTARREFPMAAAMADLEDAPKVFACGCRESQPCQDHAACTCRPYTQAGITLNVPCEQHRARRLDCEDDK